MSVRPIEPSHDAPPARVLLFSGHMVDAPGRRTARFPAPAVPVAAQAIDALLESLQVGAHELAICGGACGGDLLFAESALVRGARLELYLPFDEPTFIAESIAFANADWRARFEAAKARAALHLQPHERAPLLAGASPYETNNLWMLQAASRFGPERLHFICLWNGQGGDGPGGTQHLMQQVQRAGGRTHWLDTTRLWS